MYNQLGAYQGEEQRLYGQYLDQMDQYNMDRDFAFNAMQAAMAQNNQENQFNRGIFESDRDFNQNIRQTDISNAAAFGDWDKVEGYDYDVDFMRDQQALEEAQIAYNKMKLAQQTSMLQGATATGGTKTSTTTTKSKKSAKKDSSGTVDNAKLKELLNLSTRTASAPDFFNATVANMYQKGDLNEATYKKFLEMVNG